jgi:hypothetical protein
MGYDNWLRARFGSRMSFRRGPILVIQDFGSQHGKIVRVAGGVIRPYPQGTEQISSHQNALDVGVRNYVLDDDALLDATASRSSAGDGKGDISDIHR